MSKSDALFQNTVEIKLLGRTCELKPMSVRDAVKLGRILGQMRQEVIAAAKDEHTNILAGILQLAGTNKTQEILQILTCGYFKDVSNIDEKLSLAELSLLAKTVCEVNDFKMVMQNFTSALKAVSATPFQTP